MTYALVLPSRAQSRVGALTQNVIGNPLNGMRLNPLLKTNIRAHSRPILLQRFFQALMGQKLEVVFSKHWAFL